MALTASGDNGGSANDAKRSCRSPGSSARAPTPEAVRRVRRINAHPQHGHAQRVADASSRAVRRRGLRSNSACATTGATRGSGQAWSLAPVSATRTRHGAWTWRFGWMGLGACRGRLPRIGRVEVAQDFAGRRGAQPDGVPRAVVRRRSGRLGVAVGDAGRVRGGRERRGGAVEPAGRKARLRHVGARQRFHRDATCRVRIVGLGAGITHGLAAQRGGAPATPASRSVDLDATRRAAQRRGGRG